MEMMQWGNEPRFSNGGVDTRDLGPIKSGAMALRGITKICCQWARREEDQQKGATSPSSNEDNIINPRAMYSRITYR